MTIEMLYSKIHRATVTDANLNYVGSITIDEELLEASKMRVGQKVEILNINNGERFSTYIILGGNVVEEFVIDSEMWDEPISPADMKKQMGMYELS